MSLMRGLHEGKIREKEMGKQCREIQGKAGEKDGKVNYFTNLDAWRIEQILQPGSNTAGNSEYLEPLDTFSATPPDAVDDLPF